MFKNNILSIPVLPEFTSAMGTEMRERQSIIILIQKNVSEAISQ